MARIRRALPSALLAALLTGSLLVGPAVAGQFADEVSRFDQDAGDQVRSVEALLAPAQTVTSAIPVNPQQALIDATGDLSTDLGFPQDPSSDVLLAQLPDEVAGRLANVLLTMIDCNNITQAHFAAVEPNLEEVATTGGGLETAQFADVRACSLSLWTATNELEIALNGIADPAAPSGCTQTFGARLDVWPVIRFDGLCVANTYLNDYLLTVDLGGNDVYRNNKGSNMVDLNFAPTSSRVAGRKGFGAAKGCQRAIPGLVAADCVPAVAVLLDMAGTDTYGVKQTPDHDRGCTTDLVIRRMVTGGVGFLGVGILRDAGTTGDRYTGKTGSLGTGHVFGVGVLSDAGGSDTYAAVRNSQGFALVGGVGILRDQNGNDSYDFYMPAAIDPTAKNQQEGAGGVRDDEGEGLCDKIPRFTLGAANVLPGTIAIFIDDSGSDRYHAAFTNKFEAPLQVPSTKGGSLGFGNNQGVGIFLDLGSAADSYTVDNEPFVQGQPKRGNNRVLVPGNSGTSEGGGAGLFVDR
ncbi:MAG: hypothetical protein M3323_13045 [Actinomycetota bacterium]|nr:hypothetical protein [Actinomycetota bacterium]